MSKNLNLNNIENDELNLINEDSDYKDLITRLNEIKINLNSINKNETEEKIIKTKGFLFNEKSFLLGVVFIKNIKFS